MEMDSVNNNLLDDLKKYVLDLRDFIADMENITEHSTTIYYYHLVTTDIYWTNLWSMKIDRNILREFFTKQNSDLREQYFNFGVACLMSFIQENFTGLPLDSAVAEYLQRDQFVNEEYAQRLSVSNSEEINVNTKYPVLLVVSEVLFDTCIVDNLVNLWWCCRALLIHQQILDELSPALLSNADRLYKLIQNSPIEGAIKAELDVELAQLYLKFRYIGKAKEHIKSATTLLGITYSFTGALGKRTKHQERDVAQLTLEINQNSSGVDENGTTREDEINNDLPLNVPLKDGVRLEKIKYAEGENMPATTQLGVLEQKLFLTIYEEMFVSTPADELRTEEIQTVLDAVLNQSATTTYSLRFVALFLRCSLDNKNRRTIERCLKQCEELVNCFSKSATTEIEARHRLLDVFGTAHPPKWKVQTLYAEILLNFGLTKQSLAIYKVIQQWEEVIICYTILNMRNEAEKLIRELLKVKPTVKLLCLLGDATDDKSCYEKAWLMSRKRSHRAQRHWGHYYFERKQYTEAIPHFEKSLSINPLQPAIWLRLGYAALQTENWSTAATAYRRYTTLEPNGYEAWNNLAQAYVKIGNKRGAHQALMEALKCCDYDNWKVWENFLMVSADVGNYFHMIRAYHRLLDVKDNKYVNCEALSVLVNNVKDLPDTEGRPGGVLQKTRELMGRIIASNSQLGTAWELYADLAPLALLRTQRLQRAYRCYSMLTKWEVDSVRRVLDVCTKMAELVLDEEFSPSDMIVKSVRLNVSSALATIKKHGLDEVAEQLDVVTQKLYALNMKIDKNSATATTTVTGGGATSVATTTTVATVTTTNTTATTTSSSNNASKRKT